MQRCLALHVGAVLEVERCLESPSLAELQQLRWREEIALFWIRVYGATKLGPGMRSLKSILGAGA